MEGKVVYNTEYVRWLADTANENRAKLTTCEKRTAKALQDIGIKYKAQTPIMVGDDKGYIADFTFNICGNNIILEVDGESHVGNEEKDEERTNDLKKLGWNVIRIKNEDTVKKKHLKSKINKLLKKFKRKDKKEDIILTCGTLREEQKDVIQQEPDVDIKNDLSVLPYLSFPKDTLILARELLTPEEFGNVIMDLVNEIYCNGNEQQLRKTHTEDVITTRLRDNIERLSAGYFKKCRNLKNNKQIKVEE